VSAHDRWRVLISAAPLMPVTDQLVARLSAEGCDAVVVPGPLDADALAAAWREADAAVIDMDEATEAAIERAQRLRLISRTGAGHDTVDVTAATARGIAVTVVPGANGVAVAEFTWALILAVMRNLFALASREPLATGASGTSGRELDGKVVGLLGFGRIGQGVARRAHAFGVDVLYHDPVAATVAAAPARSCSLERLLRDSDVVSLHCPLTPTTAGLIGARELALMKRDAHLVNTARGAVVDERALAAALERGGIAGAVLDVRADERRDVGDDPLRGVPNVVFTPHVAGSSLESIARVGEGAIENLLRFKRGARNLPGLVNPHATERTPDSGSARRPRRP
jgi:phosphoglycerate dehydrogenase-like enzyme